MQTNSNISLQNQSNDCSKVCPWNKEACFSPGRNCALADFCQHSDSAHTHTYAHMHMLPTIFLSLFRFHFSTICHTSLFDGRNQACLTTYLISASGHWVPLTLWKRIRHTRVCPNWSHSPRPTEPGPDLTFREKIKTPSVDVPCLLIRLTHYSCVRPPHQNRGGRSPICSRRLATHPPSVPHSATRITLW